MYVISDTKKQPFPVANIALVNERSGRVCDLSGFRKTHKVPTDVSDYTRSFVAGLTTAELTEELDLRFAEFRKQFKFKRVDMEVQDPSDGCAAIITPQFEYRISIALDQDDPTMYVFRRQVSKINGPDAIMTESFSTVFGNVFNAMEVNPPVSINVEDFIDSMEELDKPTLKLNFDRTATWCQLTIAAVQGELTVESDEISILLEQARPPAKLLEAFFQFREELKDIEF